MSSDRTFGRQLGAKPLLRLGLGDDQADFGYDQELDPWTEELWGVLTARQTLEPPKPLDPRDVRWFDGVFMCVFAFEGAF